MLSQNQRLLRAVEEKQRETAKVAKEITEKCKAENRERTEDENAIVSECHDTLLKLDADADELKKQIEIDKDVLKFAGDGDMADVQVINEPAPEAKSWGEQFVESKSYEELIEKMQSGSLGDNWRSGGVELKGTLSVMPGTAFYQPQMQPGVVETLYQPPTVADLMAQGQTSSPIVRYITESTTVSNAAAGVAAGGAKPESTIDFVQVDEPVKKIATYLPVQDEMLEDAAQIQSYINNRLSLFIRLAEDTQLLRGAGGNDIAGLIGRTGVNTLGTAAAGTIPVEHVFKAANGVRGSSFLDPDTLVINPTSWQNIRLGKDTANQYYGGGPFYGPYGGPQGPASSNRFQTGENLWGLNVVVTSALGSGTAVVGAFREGAQVFRRSGITVEATNSHASYFTSNLTAIRAEERLALAVYRPAAFCTLTF